MSSIIKVDTVQDIDGNNIINENANTITIGASGDTITIPSGATLANNGTATGFFEGIAWQSVVTAATLTTVAGKGYPINTTSNACTVTLPTAASVGDQVQIVDYAGTFATNNITLTSSLKIEGGTDDKILTTNREGVIITYVDVTQGWVATSGVNSGSQAIDPLPYSADMLIVAGGGGGGSNDDAGDAAGGGGAGGFRTSTQNLTVGNTYTITIGDGGAGSTSGNVTGTNGSDSSISGTGLTTITSAGGGGGAAGQNPNRDGNNGGSGGGAAYNGSAGAGDTPSTSPSQGNNGGNNTSDNGGAGGGGAGAAGVDASSNAGSAGGAGTASSITGSSVTYAGGGGGGAYVGAGGAGGAGGGGAGGASGSGAVTPGTANTGGGGGGGGASADGAAGGKGVVILSMPLANFSGTTTGSPTEADDGTTKILTFTGSGSYTA